MIKILNRNHAKLIALAAMLADHIGVAFFHDSVWLRIVGRIAFPLFAFFIAEGYKHTRSRPKYIFMLLIFAVISQVPYYLFFKTFSLNTLFTFLFSILLIYLIENMRKNKINIFYFVTANIFIAMLFTINLISYGIFGVYFAVVFYFIKNTNIKLLGFSALNILIALPQIIFQPNNFLSYLQLFGLLALPLLLLYNGRKGKFNLKYLFYIFYPTHLLALYILQLFI